MRWRKLLDLSQALLLHIVHLDAVAMALLLHHIGQTHVFRIGLFDWITVRILPFGHGQTDVFAIGVFDWKAGGCIGPSITSQDQIQNKDGELHVMTPYRFNPLRSILVDNVNCGHALLLPIHSKEVSSCQKFVLPTIGPKCPVFNKKDRSKRSRRSKMILRKKWNLSVKWQDKRSNPMTSRKAATSTSRFKIWRVGMI